LEYGHIIYFIAVTVNMLQRKQGFWVKQQCCSLVVQ